MNQHLTHEQLCDLILGDPSPETTDHLRDCHLCAAELATLTQSLAAFRSATDVWAGREWIHQQTRTREPHRPASSIKTFMFPALWTAVAALLVAVTLPLALHHNAPSSTTTTANPAAVATQPSATQSDEALLEEIDQTLSSSIPSPMQPLNDPTAGRHNQSNTQRKN